MHGSDGLQKSHVSNKRNQVPVTDLSFRRPPPISPPRPPLHAASTPVISPHRAPHSCGCFYLATAAALLWHFHFMEGEERDSIVREVPVVFTRSHTGLHYLLQVKSSASLTSSFF
jgi:hypothetical protein